MTNLAQSVGSEGELARLQELVGDALAEARKRGASAAEAGLSVDRGLSVNVRLGDVETIEHHRSQGLGITVYFGQRKGSASTTDLRGEAVAETVAAACRIAAYAAEDPYAGLPDQDCLATTFPELDLYHPWELSPEDAIALALECETTARDFHPAIVNSEGASVSTYAGQRVLGNTLGFLHGYATSRHSIACSVIGESGDSMQRDDWWTVARAREDLEAASAVGEQAARRTVRRLDARSLTTRQCPVIFAADVAGGLLGHFLGAIRGGNLYRKSSFLLDSLEKPVFPEFVRLSEQPHMRRGLASAPYDSEGVATRAHDLVTAGVLKSYVLSTYSARKLGMQTTGNAGGVHNLMVDHGESDLPALLRQMGTGLLVGELMGQGVNLVTGDYSRGAAGFWVENGEIAHPVEEITIAGNLRDMYRNIVAIGSDVDRRGSIHTGSILLSGMTVAGN
ncbi:metalloprotease PmbA [Methyloterricola oryzae]|uniref:metalloprotease PmbA n=1 Tax=Methyloterricola oryzae TaxID=1495050 RepID=UPI0005EB4DBF|nr:metalloprotease PmbA [Methyloterricola oryzae]